MKIGKITKIKDREAKIECEDKEFLCPLDEVQVKVGDQIVILIDGGEARLLAVENVPIAPEKAIELGSKIE